VREVSGFTASYHIQQRIILEAKRRAIFEGNSLKEIAYGLGFCDPAHFSKYFKNSAGRNFTDFRKGACSPS
jgi:AraC-like DNA-binding protein